MPNIYLKTTVEGKEIYKRRASSVECVNAQVRNRGLYQFLVRGLNKVKSVTMMMAVVHNMTRTLCIWTCLITVKEGTKNKF